MTDPFSDYVTLLDEVEQIPVTARESPSLSAEQRAATTARVLELVRGRVLPQSDREQAGFEALFEDAVAALARDQKPPMDHDAILAPVDELACADPRDGPRIQELLYRIHAAITRHFGEAEFMVASAAVDEPPRPGVRTSTSRRPATDTLGPPPPDSACWFG